MSSRFLALIPRIVLPTPTNVMPQLYIIFLKKYITYRLVAPSITKVRRGSLLGSDILASLSRDMFIVSFEQNIS